jgi:glycosylphosphatidylinositol transamidase (GPIT) subunit GPI8
MNFQVLEELESHDQADAVKQMKEKNRWVIVSLFLVDNKRLKVLIGKVI